MFKRKKTIKNEFLIEQMKLTMDRLEMKYRGWSRVMDDYFKSMGWIKCNGCSNCLTALDYTPGILGSMCNGSGWHPDRKKRHGSEA